MSSLACVHCAVPLVYNVTYELSRLIIRCVLCVELYLYTEAILYLNGGA